MFTATAAETAIVAVGSNIGNRANTIHAALRELETQGCKIQRTSFLYESSPMYVTDQPAFLNGAVQVSTSLPPVQLLRKLKKIEHELGRSPSGVRYGPRPIDLDIICYGERRVEEGSTLIVPHPRLHEREFVLRPMCDISESIPVPLQNETKTAKQLLQQLLPDDASELQKVTPTHTGKLLRWGEGTLLMGVINATPDSFSDGGVHSSIDTALRQVEKFCEHGFDVVDVSEVCIQCEKTIETKRYDSLTYEHTRTRPTGGRPKHKTRCRLGRRHKRTRAHYAHHQRDPTHVPRTAHFVRHVPLDSSRTSARQRRRRDQRHLWRNLRQHAARNALQAQRSVRTDAHARNTRHDEQSTAIRRRDSRSGARTVPTHRRRVQPRHEALEHHSRPRHRLRQERQPIQAASPRKRALPHAHQALPHPARRQSQKVALTHATPATDHARRARLGHRRRAGGCRRARRRAHGARARGARRGRAPRGGRHCSGLREALCSTMAAVQRGYARGEDERPLDGGRELVIHGGGGGERWTRCRRRNTPATAADALRRGKRSSSVALSEIVEKGAARHVLSHSQSRAPPPRADAELAPTTPQCRRPRS
ncbi:2-amino-4-hydroxy-6-hydroxymethyldihydropteridine diphosphokinase [Gracilaria domingensis]|nr:2-amino-4-hydroxy-6-hydroxymethyldihydropteridine diphosphokinase [Gracilaria domingensis]